jgi:hypothetical protein
MARLAQQRLFQWSDVDAADELQRLDRVLEALPDEALMVALERHRGRRGRDDYPVRAMWNALVAGVVYGHKDAASLLRELARNPALRARCGFASQPGAHAVPTANAFTNFLANLLERGDEIVAMFDALVDGLATALPDLGRRLAVDGKAIRSFARGVSREEAEEAAKDPSHRTDDRRGDHDADWGVKHHHGKRKDGTAYEKVTTWFGYKLHLLVDSVYELPLAFKVTKASGAEQPELLELLKGVDRRHPDIIERAEELAADKGYDTVENVSVPYDVYGIKPVIDIRNVWQSGEETRALFDQQADTIVYDYRGRVTCICPETQIQRPLAYQGFEADRGTLKYRCPVAAHGGVCQGQALCPGACNSHGRIVRIPLSRDRRIFTPLARGTKSWERAYDRRTAVERVNSRFDQVLGFERHTIRGLAKMRVRTGLALVVMLAMALGWIRAKRPEMMRSIIGTVKPRLKAA